MSKNVYIIGAYNSKFGNLEQHDIYSLYSEAARGAIEDAGISPGEIDAVFVGNYSGGSFNNQEHIAPYGTNVFPELRHKPMYRAENACASGSSAVHLAEMAIKSGKAKKVLVVGVEKMNSLDTKNTSLALAKASYWTEEGAQGYTFPGLFAEYAKGWLAHYEHNPDDLRGYLAQIASKAYNFGAKNPLAHLQKERSAQEILNLPDEKNPMIAPPLRLHDCSLISDGSSALVLSSEATGQKVEIAATSNASDYLNIVNGKRSNYFLEGAAQAVNRAFKDSGLGIDDIQLAEVHDCFTITELLIYSALGLTEKGREYKALEDGEVFEGGRCVINPSGGLKAKGHPVGATGVSMHALMYKQLTDQAIGYQVKDANVGLVLNIGGSGATNMVSILKRD